MCLIWNNITVICSFLPLLLKVCGFFFLVRKSLSDILCMFWCSWKSTKYGPYGKQLASEEEGQDFSKIPGQAGVDYPLYHSVPETRFSCGSVPFLPGIYANVETGCQVNTNFRYYFHHRREMWMRNVCNRVVLTSKVLNFLPPTLRNGSFHRKQNSIRFSASYRLKKIDASRGLNVGTCALHISIILIDQHCIEKRIFSFHILLQPNDWSENTSEVL